MYFNNLVFLFYTKQCIITSAENIIGGVPLLYFAASMTLGDVLLWAQVVANCSIIKGYISPSADRASMEVYDI